MMLRSSLRFAAAAVVLSLGLGAETLTLDEAVRSTLSSHPDIRAAMLKIHQSEQSVGMERSAWKPQVSIHAEYDPQRTFTLPQNGGFATVDHRSWNLGASLSQQLFDFSRSSYRIEAARLRRQIDALSARERKALMRYEVRNAYALVLVQQAALRARIKDLEAKRASWLQAKALFKQGLKTRADAYRFRSAMEAAKEGVALARAAYRKARYGLEQYLGRPLKASTRLTATLLRSRPPLPALPRSAKALDTLSLRSASLAVSAAGAQTRALERERFGTVQAIADVERFDGLSRYDTATVGIRYSAPIYSGGRLGAQTQQSRIGQMVAAADRDSLRRRLWQEIRSTLADYRETQSAIEARRAQIRSALETLKLLQARYKEGLATYIEVLDAQSVLLQARLGLLSAYYNRLERSYRLEYLNAK